MKPPALNDALLHFGLTTPPQRIDIGLINEPYQVGDVCLQRLHPVFDPAIHHNIEAVVTHLRARGVEAPRLLGTFDRWRIMDWLPGESFSVPTPERVRSAASLLARFHAGLDDLAHTFVGTRAGLHDTERHLQALAAVLPQADARVRAVGLEILAQSIAPLRDSDVRIVHGDPKLNNFLFRAGVAVALIDLDTVHPGSRLLELGDALRSWCNAGGEDDTGATFSVALFDAACSGYGIDDRQACLRATHRIAVELAARFCKDAVTEQYFAWDRARFARARDHNLVRARGQLALAKSVAELASNGPA
jgi:aminoglycoside phosphotransferase (APT) family kinase protein